MCIWSLECTVHSSVLWMLDKEKHFAQFLWKPRVGSGAARIGPAPFITGGHKRHTKPGCGSFR